MKENKNISKDSFKYFEARQFELRYSFRDD